MARAKSRAISPDDLPARFTAFFDGCCEPKNPGGTAGYGCVIFDSQSWTPGPVPPHPKYGGRVYDRSGMIPAAPQTSNNLAEYLAVLDIMRWAIGSGNAGESFRVYGDSRLVICQLWGWPPGSRKWRIRGIDCDPQVRPGFYAESAIQARALLKQLPRMQGFWIPREENSHADELSKAELHRAGVQFKIQPEA